jgi:hypothetical protein
MGRKFVLVDDLDGSELPDDTKPVTFSIGRTTYNLYLSDKNHEKFLNDLNKYIVNAETVAGAARGSSSFTAGPGDREKLKKVREWAQATGYKYKNAKGEEVTLGDRGRIPQEIVDAYDAAN